MSERLAARIVIALACLAEIDILVLHWRVFGWSLLLAAAVFTWSQNDPFRRRLLVILGALALLALAPVSTNLGAGHVLRMSLFLIPAAILPAYILRRYWDDRVITFRFHQGRHWYRAEVFYILTWGLFAYLIMPYYFSSTGAYHNWQVGPDPASLIALGVACAVVGVWDELFFVNTILGVFRHYLPFVWANLAQSIIFTTFLYELGFRGWAPLGLIPFTLLQGYIFKRTESLLYVITIHLTVDLVLYLALINATYPQALPIFITN